MGRSDAEGGEDDSQFLLGRRGRCDPKSLVKGLDERYENVSQFRSFKRRAWARTPWEDQLGSLIEVLPWKKVRAWKEKTGKNTHINVLELRGRRKLAGRLSRRRSFHKKRHLYVTDSRVAEAVGSRGRSSAKRLNHEMRMTVPDVAGGDFCLPGFWSESARMPADEPSRGKPVRPASTPTKFEEEILAGIRPLVSRRTVREWQRGLWRPRPPPPLKRFLCGYAGQRVGEAKRPGPRPAQKRSRSVPLVKSVTEKIEIQYEKGFKSLTTFLKSNRFDPPHVLAEMHARDYNAGLTAWVKQCYEGGHPKDLAVGGLLKFSQRFWWCRPHIRPCWDLIEEWEYREPGEHRTPAHPVIVRACIALCLAWCWVRVAVMLWVGFHCLLRPGELIDLKVGDFRYMPGRRGAWGFYVVVVREPKTRRRYARVQHVIAEELLLVMLIYYSLRFRDASEYFYGFTSSTLNKRLSTILAALGVPDLFTLAGLRAGGATWEWLTNRNFSDLRLRGRWMNAKTLESYIQEAVAELTLGSLSQATVRRLEAVGEATAALVAERCA